MNARTNILKRLRSVNPSPLPLPEVIIPQLIDVGEDKIEHFRQQLISAHAEVIISDDWRKSLAQFCADKKIADIVIPNFNPDWLCENHLQIANSQPKINVFNLPIEDIKAQLFNEYSAGLTIADCAIIDTGTLVVKSSAAQPRSLSLVPPINIIVIEKSRFYNTLPEALTNEKWQNNFPSNLIFISGPSKTADIQQTLAYGAHGPKELLVIISSEKVL